MKRPSKLTVLLAACALMAIGALPFTGLTARAWAIEKYQATPGKFRCAPVAVATAAPTTVIAGSSEHNAWAIQNLGPNPIYCNGDSSIVVSTTNSVQVAANGGFLTSDMFGSPNSSSDTIKCIAATALQVSPADTRKCEGW